MTMSDRQENGWFCPGCARYDRNLPTIYSGNPAHPEFHDRVENDPGILEGHTVELSPYGTTDLEYVGTISEVDSDDTVHILETPAEPFEEVERRIDLDRFKELLHKSSDPIRQDPIPEDKMVIVL